MTIFGYNTDVKHADVVYHVQSEARQNDLLLQTLIYVKGQCVGKHAFSYAAKTLEPDFSETAIHDLLKAQHRNMVDGLHEGRLDSVLVLGANITDVGGSGLALLWSNPNEQGKGGKQNMRFQVMQAAQPAASAEVIVRGAQPGEPVVLAEAQADSSGYAVIELDLSGMTEPAVIVRASCSGKSVTRKFRFRK